MSVENSVTGMETGIQMNQFNYKGSDIFEAAVNGDFPLVFMLLSLGVDPNATGKNEATALHWAAFKGHADICTLLIQKGAKVNVPTADAEASPPLIWACMGAQTECVKILVENGADVNEVSGNGGNSIMYAVQKGKVELVHYLYKKGANFIKDEHQHTCVHWAAYTDSFAVLKYLVEVRHLSVQAFDDKNRTPLHWAAKQGHLDCCKYLIAKGCEYKEKDLDDKTAADLAKDNKHTFVAQYLVKPDDLEIRPETHWEMMRNPKDFMNFSKSFIYIVGAFLLCAWTPVWSIVFIWGFVFYLMYNLMQATFKKLTRTETFVGWWWGSVVISYGTWFWNIFRVNSEWLVVSLVLIVITTLLIYFWFNISHSDPGFIPFSESERDELFKTIDNGGTVEKEFCTTCMIKKPLRSKHDPLTGRCIARFDHYCIWMNCPVGYKTHRRFVSFCYLHVLCNYTLFFLGFTHVWTQGFSVQSLFYDNPTVSHVLIFYNLLIGSMIAYLSYDQSWLWANNLTTNEYSQRKYPYVLPDGKRAFSLFNDGFVNNAKQFWSGDVKWEQVFECIPSDHAKKWCQGKGITCPTRVTQNGAEKDDFGFLGF